MKTFVMGDIHGAWRAVRQCFERSGFNKQEDRLIVLGDVGDVWPQTRECVEELLSVKQCDCVLGNHDMWLLDWAKKGAEDPVWLEQGGVQTMTSYRGGVPEGHIAFLERARLFIEEGSRLFVHAGFDPNRPVAEQGVDSLAWTRDFLVMAFSKDQRDRAFRFGGYDDIFVGHNPTLRMNRTAPVHMCNVWAMDTGAGWTGRLTIMDVDTKEFWQSDQTPLLYPDDDGRMR